MGCVTFGREIDEKTSFDILDKAYESGITLFDTAQSYGSGASESIIGKWLTLHAGIRENITIATKVLPPFESEHLQQAVNASLQRLQVENLDILYLHRWDVTAESDTCVMELDRMVQSRKVETLGASNFNAHQLGTVLNFQKRLNLNTVQFVQNNHNLAVSDIDNELEEMALKNQIRLIGYSPLGAGYLTGKYQDGLEEGSRFQLVPGHQQIYFHERANRRLLQLLKIAGQTGHTPSHLALSWAFHHRGLSSVLIGARSVQHVTQALDAWAFNDKEIFRALESEYLV